MSFQKEGRPLPRPEQRSGARGRWDQAPALKVALGRAFLYLCSGTVPPAPRSPPQFRGHFRFPACPSSQET